MLVLAGYPLTGGSVMLASLETARGGLSLLSARSSRYGLAAGLPALAHALMGPYCALIGAVVRRFHLAGQFIEERPFVTSSMIKLPMRLEFVLRNLFAGDPVGVAIGLSWMVLGDGALALNDRRFREWLGTTFGSNRRAELTLA